MTQYAYDPLDFGSREAAKERRDLVYRTMKANGVKVKRFILRDQLKPYAGFGLPDGRVRDIFYIQVVD